MSSTDEPYVPPLEPVCSCGHCTGAEPSFKHMTPLQAVEVQRTGSRKHGATQKQFQEFIRAADAGLRVEMHGQNYVAMSRNIYDELKRAANPISLTVEESVDLRNDVMNEIHRIWTAEREPKS